MLNLAFINIVTPTASTSIRKAAIDLIYAVFVSFSFGKTMTVEKMDKDILPDNMFEYVSQLSNDLANNNQDSSCQFLTEFFKSAKYVAYNIIPSIITFIPPWVKIYIRNPDEKPEIIQQFIELYSTMNRFDQLAFQESIWPIFATNTHCIEMIMEDIFKDIKPSVTEIIPQFAYLNSPLVTKIWAVNYLEKTIEEKNENIAIICSIIQNLIALHVFDFEGCIAKLIHLLSKLRIQYQTKTIIDSPMLLTDVIHEIFRRSGKGKQIEYKPIIVSLMLRKGEDEFKEGKDNRTWPAKAHTIADTLSDIIKDLGNTSIQQQVYELFYNDIQSNDKFIRAQAIIYSSAFSLTPDQTAQYLLNLIRKDESIIGEVCLGLSLINMTKELAAKLFFIGCVLAVHYSEPSACDLIASAARYFSLQAGSTDSILELIPKEIVEYLQTCTQLPFNTHPLTSALMIIACYTDGDHARTLRKIAECNTKEPIPGSLRVIIDKDLIPELSDTDFGADLANITAALVLFLNGTVISSLRDFAISLFTQHPQGLGCFDVIGPKFGKDVLQTVNNARFTGLLLRNATIKCNDYKLTPILLQKFSEGQKIQITKEQKDYLVNTIIPEN